MGLDSWYTAGDKSRSVSFSTEGFLFLRSTFSFFSPTELLSLAKNYQNLLFPSLRSREMRNRKLLMAMPLKTWIVMWQKRDAQTGQSLLQALQRTMPGLGMQIGPPQQVVPLWARTTKNTDWSTGPLARPFAPTLAPLTCSLALHYLLRSRAPLRSLVCSLAHFSHSLAHGKVNYQMAILFCVFFPYFWTIVLCKKLQFSGRWMTKWTDIEIKDLFFSVCQLYYRSGWTCGRRTLSIPWGARFVPLWIYQQNSLCPCAIFWRTSNGLWELNNLCFFEKWFRLRCSA